MVIFLRILISEPPRGTVLNTLGCVIFDIDGTLARSNDLIFASFNHVTMKYLGKEFAAAEIIGLFGPPEEGALEKILPVGNVSEAMNDLCNFYESHHTAMVSLHEGIREILDFLISRGVLLGVFTGKGRRTAGITLKKLGIRHYFSSVMTGSDVERHKPDAEGVLRIMDDLSVRPDQTLIVGDSISDIRAGQAAGVAVASVLWDSYDPDAVMTLPVSYRFGTVDEFDRWLRGRVGHHPATQETGGR